MQAYPYIIFICGVVVSLIGVLCGIILRDVMRRIEKLENYQLENEKWKQEINR